MAGIFFNFTAHTIDGQILEVPKVVQMYCDKVNPLRQDIVRQYDKNLCIVSRKVFLVYYGGHLFGSTAFTTMAQFLDYRNANCRQVDDCCYVTYNNCYITFNGNRITI